MCQPPVLSDSRCVLPYIYIRVCSVYFVGSDWSHCRVRFQNIPFPRHSVFRKSCGLVSINQIIYNVYLPGWLWDWLCACLSVSLPVCLSPGLCIYLQSEAAGQDGWVLPFYLWRSSADWSLRQISCKFIHTHTHTHTYKAIYSTCIDIDIHLILKQYIPAECAGSTRVKAVVRPSLTVTA